MLSTSILLVIIIFSTCCTNAFILSGGGSCNSNNRVAFQKQQRCGGYVGPLVVVGRLYPMAAPLVMSSSSSSNSLEEPSTTTVEESTSSSSTSSSSSSTEDHEITATTTSTTAEAQEEDTQQQQQQKKEEDVKLYIGNISYDETKANIRKLFQTYGEVTDVFLPLNRETREGRGFGFVAMKDRTAAEKAIQELNESTFGERTIYVNVAGEQPPRQQQQQPKKPIMKRNIKLYVGNISFEASEDDLKALFQNYGTVYDCFLPTWPDTGNPRGFAFITMEPEDAELAITNIDGTEWNGRIINVSKAMARKEKMEKLANTSGSNASSTRRDITKLYVGNISFDSTEDTIRQLFEQYGEVTNVYVPMDYDYDRNRGFAFVTMVGTAAADQAIRDTDGTDLDGRTIRVNVANGKGDRRASNDDWTAATTTSTEEEGSSSFTSTSSSWEGEN